jgi:small subunit ribosomal protein S20
MPNIASAKKRLRQNKIRRDRNRANRSRVRNMCKKVLKAVAEGNVEQAETSFAEAIKALDKAGSAKLIHRNTADRKKSRLSAMIRKLKQSKSA